MSRNAWLYVKDSFNDFCILSIFISDTVTNPRWGNAMEGVSKAAIFLFLSSFYFFSVFLTLLICLTSVLFISFSHSFVFRRFVCLFINLFH